jgi:hypothetical protein
LAHDLAGDEPPGDIEAVWLEERECLGSAKPCIVGHPGRRGELGHPVRPEHEHPNAEARAPVDSVEAHHAGRVQDDEAAKAMGGPVVATGAPVHARQRSTICTGRSLSHYKGDFGVEPVGRGAMRESLGRVLPVLREPRSS